MKESVLNKEFNSRDVERIRNIVRKDYSASTKQGVGYEKSYRKFEEGDQWEENGKVWTIKNGIKQNVTKLDTAKRELHMPLACPKCKGSLKSRLSKKMYKIHGVCFDCTLEQEAALKRAGLYSQYEKRLMEGNMRAFITDIEQWALAHISTVDTFVTEQGDVESWQHNSTEASSKVMTNVKDYVNQLMKHLTNENT
jgi:uncharacterized protein YbaR (Trm112 family)